MKVNEVSHDGVEFVYADRYAFLDHDGIHWDYSERMNRARPPEFSNFWAKGEVQYADEDEQIAHEIWTELPNGTRGWLTGAVKLRFEDILDIDETGDEFCRQPHVYTTPWHPSYGPFGRHERVWIHIFEGDRTLSFPPKEDRVKKFPRKGDPRPPAKPRDETEIPE